MSSRERLYLNAIAALFKDGGAGPKAARDEGYRDAMAIAYAAFPTTLWSCNPRHDSERAPRVLSVKLTRLVARFNQFETI
jgi:hypothetical protein